MFCATIHGMKPQFIQIGRYHINLNSIGYIVSGPGWIRIVTTAIRGEGKAFSILLRTKDAEKVMEVIKPFIVARVDLAAN